MTAVWLGFDVCRTSRLLGHYMQAETENCTADIGNFLSLIMSIMLNASIGMCNL